MSPDHTQVIRSFYEAFARRDGEAMSALYHPRITFSDPVFPHLVGPQAGAMWRMLCGRANDLEVTYRDVEADEQRGRAHWEARYTFSATGRKVHNIIEARFRFSEGRIIEHVDTFDFWRWSRMAIGPMGVLLGWSPLVRNKVRSQARRGLESFMAKAA